MDLAETYILEFGFVFFAAWGVALAALSVIAFGRDISIARRGVAKQSL
jgi:hypothetical protein